MDLERVARQEAALVLSARRSRPSHVGEKLPGLMEGADRALEEWADEILLRDRRRFYSQNRKPGSQFLPYDILSSDQLEMRKEREVLTDRLDHTDSSGPYHRAYNPLAEKRPTNRTLDGGQWGTPRWDARIGMVNMSSGVDPWFVRDKGMCPIDSRYWAHLDRGQRCRIRAAVRRVPLTHRRLAMAVLAVKYGVEPYIISRICQKK